VANREKDSTISVKHLRYESPSLRFEYIQTVREEAFNRRIRGCRVAQINRSLALDGEGETVAEV